MLPIERISNSEGVFRNVKNRLRRVGKLLKYDCHVVAVFKHAVVEGFQAVFVCTINEFLDLFFVPSKLTPNLNQKRL